jgi:hypothetical protein
MPNREVGDQGLGCTRDASAVRCVWWHDRRATRVNAPRDSVDDEDDAPSYDVPHFFLFVLVFMEIVCALFNSPASERHVCRVKERP